MAAALALPTPAYMIFSALPPLPEQRRGGSLGNLMTLGPGS